MSTLTAEPSMPARTVAGGPEVKGAGAAAPGRRTTRPTQPKLAHRRTGTDVGLYGQPGSNGLTLDRQGRLTINEHGNWRVTRLEAHRRPTCLAHPHDDTHSAR